jgi:hypothetical protein
MSLGNAWTETTTGSVSKLNTSTIIYGTGSYLSTLDITKHKILVCTEDGSTFLKDHVYLCDADGTSIIDLSDTNDHDHTSAAGDGGAFSQILGGNTNLLDSGMYLAMNSKKANWREVITGTGVISDDTDGTTNEHSIKLDTGGTTASTASIAMPALEWDPAEPGWFKCMVRVGTASSFACKVGMGMENLADADNNDRKYGFEMCTTVNNNWFAISANGTTRSASDTGTAFNANRNSFRVHHFPDTPKIDLSIDEGTTFTKTSNIPTDSFPLIPAPDRIFRYSVKNNTGASRTLFVYGTRIVYETHNKWHS